MAKLQRVPAKVFGETASPSGADPQIGQFGSAKIGTYIGTSDIRTIQALPAWSNGWIDAVTPNTQFPTLPEMTGVHKVLSYQNAYILQQGIPEWDSETTYFTNGFCSYSGTIYKSLVDDNTNNTPSSSPTKWEVANAADTDNLANIDLSNLSLTGEARFSGKANVELNNINPSSTTKGVFAGWAFPNYSSATTKLKQTLYTATTNGYFYVSCSAWGGDSTKQVTINGTSFNILRVITQYGETSVNVEQATIFPLKKGDTYKYESSAGDVQLLFIPAQ